MEEFTYLANGHRVPTKAVDALNEFENRWPGASFPGARPALALVVLTSVGYFSKQGRALERLKVCKEEHGSEDNPATVYGHHGSPRTCVRLHGIDIWVYDPEWEKN